MIAGKGKLVFFCGKMGAGKSTLAATIAEQYKAVLLSEDEWLSQLYPEQIQSFDDYIRLSRQIRPLVSKLVKDMLLSGISVVMDFPANTRNQRSWFSELCAEARCDHEMIYLEATDEVCLQHLAIRRDEQPERSAFDTKEVFMQVSQYFEEPQAAEQLNCRKITVQHNQ